MTDENARRLGAIMGLEKAIMYRNLAMFPKPWFDFVWLRRVKMRILSEIIGFRHSDPHPKGGQVRSWKPIIEFVLTNTPCSEIKALRLRE